MTGVLIKRGNLDRETDMLRGKTMWRDTGRSPFENKSYGATSQWMAGLPEASFPNRFQRDYGPSDTLM